MKKLFVFLGALSLTLMLVLGGPMFSTAATSTSNSEVQSVYSKVIENHRVTFLKGVQPPRTYYYSVNGWSGTLRLSTVVPAGDFVHAYYSGTVNCTAPCIVSTDKES